MCVSSPIAATTASASANQSGGQRSIPIKYKYSFSAVLGTGSSFLLYIFLPTDISLEPCLRESRTVRTATLALSSGGPLARVGAGHGTGLSRGTESQRPDDAHRGTKGIAQVVAGIGQADAFLTREVASEFRCNFKEQMEKCDMYRIFCC